MHACSALASCPPTHPPRSPCPLPTAAQLHQEMQGLGVQENVVALTALAKALGATPGMAPDLLRLLRRMQRGPAR